jgi:hypothetical protein
MRPFAGTEAIRQFVNPRSMHTVVKLRLLTCEFRKQTTKEFVLVQAPIGETSSTYWKATLSIGQKRSLYGTSLEGSFMADKEAILDALFERSFEGLSLVAQRVFLTLCNWRSVVAVTCLQAVNMESVEEQIDARGAVEDLRCSSLIEASEASLTEKTLFRFHSQRRRLGGGNSL